MSLPLGLVDVIAATPRARAAELADQAILPPLPSMQELCRRAAHTAGTPWGVLTIITAEEQVAKATWGGPDAPDGRVPLTYSICFYVVAKDERLVAPDTLLAPHIASCLALPDVRAYTGAPIHLQGLPIGALAGIGPEPQAFTARHEPRLAALADEASDLIARTTARARRAPINRP